MRLPLIITAVMVCVACSETPDPIESEITKYREWEKVTHRVLEYPVPGHGTGARVVYANDTAFSVKASTPRDKEKKMVLPEGSIFVKESYRSKKEIGAANPELYIMKKTGGYPESTGGWRYYMKKPGMKPVIITGRMCVGCHESANEKHPYFDGNEAGLFRDYIFAPIAR